MSFDAGAFRCVRDGETKNVDMVGEQYFVRYDEVLCEALMRAPCSAHASTAEHLRDTLAALGHPGVVVLTGEPAGAGQHVHCAVVGGDLYVRAERSGSKYVVLGGAAGFGGYYREYSDRAPWLRAGP